MVDMNDDDAICVNYVAITGPDNNQMAWYGDVGFSCGADWYHSQYKIGKDNYMPRCTWIDKNKSNGLRHVGMGIHITDFNTDSDALAKQYQDFPDSMCKTAPRFKMYENIGHDDVIPVYFPPLELNDKNLRENTDKDPIKVALNQGIAGGDPALKIPSKREISSNYTDTPLSIQTNTTDTRQTNNAGDIFDGHLIVSHHEQHSAVELCEAHYSVGPDFVSFHEEIFCDMYTKQTWPLCANSVAGSKDKNATVALGETMNMDNVLNSNTNVASSVNQDSTSKAATATSTTNTSTSNTGAASVATNVAPQVQPKINTRNVTPSDATYACFDTVKKVMRNAGPHRRDAANGKPIPDKSYEHSAHWH